MKKKIVSMKKKFSIFSLCNGILLCAMAVMGIIPFVHMISVAFSGPEVSAANLVSFWPIDFNIKAFIKVFADDQFVRSTIISMIRVVGGTLITMLLTIVTAYPLSLSDREFPGRKIYVVYMMIVMLFTGGLIPNYILITRMGLTNTIWALIIPGAIPVFNVIVLLNFYRGLPKELRESAKVDGADDFKCLLKIYIPLSKPSLATLTMFCIIGHWNAWFDGILYMRERVKYPLQTYIQTFLASLSESKSLEAAAEQLAVSDRSLMYAYIALACVPILIVYPLLSRHVKSGLVLGSVKG